MTAQPAPRSRTGRTSDTNLINALNRRYSVLLGHYEAMERECEDLSGSALIEAQERIESDQVLIRRVLDAIGVVARHIDPEWSDAARRPIRPTRRDSSTGKITRTAATILRERRVPMSVREVSKSAVAAHGLPLTEQNLERFDSVIHTSFARRVGYDLGVLPGPPRRYFVQARASEA